MDKEHLHMPESRKDGLAQNRPLRNQVDSHLRQLERLTEQAEAYRVGQDQLQKPALESIKNQTVSYNWAMRAFFDKRLEQLARLRESLPEDERHKLDARIKHLEKQIKQAGAHN